jgi:hypothetical protein
MVDRPLDDPGFIQPFRVHFDPRRGRPSIPIENYLRLMFLKHRYGLGYELLCREVADSISWPVSGGELAAQPAPAAAPNRPTFLKEVDPLLASRGRVVHPPVRIPPAWLGPANRPARRRPTGLQAEGQGDTTGQHDGTVQPDQLRLRRQPQLGRPRLGSSNASAPPVTNIAAKAARPTARMASIASSIRDVTSLS